ncbi:kelch-like protein 12 isoform X1 [Branchiostoma floridae]|uniref:Kelch-like protein 12 isoform X1 n=1 Tax=Branchiostoma floridae TaxID=7739 RepID=A0A9J7HKZ2_BRAFL|nr:kelch-like protein 12 isoform X1 [Branchiostoma floridae]
MAAADHVSADRPRFYQNESYLHGFLGTVGDLQKDGVLQDIVLEVEGQRFPCHRLVLSAASPYFRAMFTSDMAESRKETVVLQGLDVDIFGEILSYIYSGTIHVSMDKVQPLYQAADLLQLDYVRDTCGTYMAMNVEGSSCVDLYKFADVFSVDIVTKSCLKWKASHFTEVASSEEFCSLGMNELTDIISHDELDVKEETTVWEAVVRWVQHSRKDRLHHLPSILPHIRFNLLTSDDTAAILKHPLVKENRKSSEVIRKVTQKGNPNLRPRLGMYTEVAILKNWAENGIELLFINPRGGKFISCTYSPEDLPRPSHMTVTSDNEIYILTREESEVETQLSLFKYNPAKNVWEDAGVPSISRERHQKWSFFKELLFEVDGTLYYVPVDEDRSLVQMKKYNRHTKQWLECSPLHFDDFEDGDDPPHALSCGSHIYLLANEVMHRYDPSLDQWSKRTPPMDMPELSTAVAMGTEIFCADVDFTDTMVYDTESDRWQKLRCLPNAEDLDIDDLPYLFVLENQLHILVTGAYNAPVVYAYDRSADSWKDVATLPNERYHAYGCSSPVARIYLPYLKEA